MKSMKSMKLIHRNTPRIIATLLSSFSLAACSQTESKADEELKNGKIPRFPDNGVPKSIPKSGPTTGNKGTPTSSEPNLTKESPSFPTTTASETSSSADTSKESLTQDSSTSSENTSETTSTEIDEVPAEYPFVDLGMFVLDLADSGVVRGAVKYKHPGEDCHQFSRLSNNRFPTKDPIYNDRGNRIRNFYLAFNTRGLNGQEVTRAEIEFYMFAPNDASAGAGGYSSRDDSETVHIKAIDRYTAQEMIEAVFGKPKNVDQEKRKKRIADMAMDLEDGELLGEITVSPETISVTNISPAPTNPSPGMDCSEKNRAKRTCGTWITIELNEAGLKSLRESKGLWATGWSIGSRNYFTATEEDLRKLGVDPAAGLHTRVFWGGYIDCTFNKTRRPKPRLIINRPKEG